jgi:cell division protein FtsQ
MIKRILSIVVWTISIAGLLVLLGFARENYRNTFVHDMHIRINRKANTGFLDTQTITNEVIKVSDSLIGKQVKQLKPDHIKSHIHTNPWIAKSNVSTGIDGVFRVQLYEREALLRAYNSKGYTIYIDKNGILFPTSPNYTPRVLIASGYINFPILPKKGTAHLKDSLYINTRLSEIHLLTKTLQSNEFLEALVDQIYINSLGEFELSPKLGRATVIIGSLENLDEKLANMQLYYEKSAQNTEMLNYRSINMKYRNQIVCTKI